jgi:hypothetical protein
MTPRFETGRKIRSEVLGEQRVRARLEGADESNRGEAFRLANKVLKHQESTG